MSSSISLNPSWPASSECAPSAKRNPVQVRFGSASDRTYTAHYKEHETNADPATLTFKVTFSLPTPDDLNVLPGMSATVIADLSGLFPEADSRGDIGANRGGIQRRGGATGCRSASRCG